VGKINLELYWDFLSLKLENKRIYYEIYRLCYPFRRSKNFFLKNRLIPTKGYGGIGLYPYADYLTHAADAIYYLTKDERLYHNGDAGPFDITHLPGHKQYGDKVNNGDHAPFDITHIPGHKQYGDKVNNGDKEPFDISHVPGKSVSFKSFVKLTEPQKPIAPPDSPNIPEE
jgi:hypothetical protein